MTSQSPVPEPVVFDQRFHQLVDAESLLEAGHGFAFTEGPVMLPEGYLVFSDIPNDTIVRFTRPDRTATFRHPSGGANGNTVDVEGRLVTCETGVRRVTRTEPGGSITLLADEYEGKRLNAPNDIVVRSDGAIYFTDPIFLGPFDELLRQSYRDLDFAGVFRIAPSGDLTLLTTDLPFPNGLAFSPDESVLYVVNSSDNSVYGFDVKADGSVGEKRLGLTMSYDSAGVGDGMKVDTAGNLYVTGPGGVWVASADGTPLGIIRLPETAANLAFYGFDAKVLFITASTRLYMVRLKVPGVSVVERARRAGSAA